MEQVMSMFLVLLMGLFWFLMYWLPTIVAAIRKVPNAGSVIVVNAFLGWTFVGWVVAMAMAARTQPCLLHRGEGA